MSIASELLRQIPLFAPLDSDDLTSIALLTRTCAYQRGAIIMLEGASDGGLYFVSAGVVRIFKTSAEGKEQTLRLVEAGHTFNDVPALDGGPNPASAGALESCELYVIGGPPLRHLMAERPRIALAAVRTLAQALRHMVGLVEDLSFRPVTARVAKILLEQDAALHTRPSTHRLTQQEMAALAGTAREVVGRSLKELEAAGAITLHQGRAKIINAKFLQMLAVS